MRISHLLALAAALCSASAHASTLTVTSLDDDGPGSLRATIQQASAGDSIVFDTSLFPESQVYVITLLSPLPTIDRSLGIYGPGPQTLRLDGDESTALLLYSGTQNSELEGINLSRGFVDPGHGGAVTIEQGASLHLEDCLVDYNVALNTGGAIRVIDGSLDVADCSFFGNSGSFGGAIMMSNLAGQVNIRRSRFQSNSASAAGGAIAANAGSLLIENSTFVGNAAVTGPSRVGVGGAIYADGSVEITLVNNTLHGNFADLAGGAIRTQQTGNIAVMANTALTGNQTYEPMAFPATVAENCSINGSIGLSESNLEDADSCGFGFPSQFLTDPQYDGFVIRGPNGLTAALRPLPGSPLLDTGNGLLCAGPDVTGAPRPQDGNQDSFAGCDIGSFEYDGYSLFRNGMEPR